MKRIIIPFAILFSALVLTASCLNDDNDDNITYYGDTAITSFSLGTMNRYLTTKALTQVDENGNPLDSVYKETYTGSSYVFTIDQLQREIYNPDSLPLHTDPAHVICTVGTKNSGLLLIKDVDSDTLRYYQSTDSIDFTHPREFRVYANDGSAYRNYTVKLNVHQEDPDSFRWNRVAVDNRFMAASQMKALCFNGNIFIFCQEGTVTKVYKTNKNNSSACTLLDTNMSLDADACTNATVFENMLYTMSDGKVLCSVDGAAWYSSDMVNAVSEGEEYYMPQRLLGGTGHKLYAYDAQGRVLWSDLHGIYWQLDRLLDDAAMLPKQDISLMAMPVATNSSTERIVLVGNPAEGTFATDSVALVWNKVEEYTDGSQTHAWMSCTERNGNRLPRLAKLKVCKYGDVLVALGGKGEAASKAEPFSHLYVSYDNGLSWQTEDKYVLPEGFDNTGSDVSALAVDEENCLWIFCGANGQVWRGRLNQLGWK